MSGQGFELSAFGPVPIGTPYLNPDTITAEQVAHLIVTPDMVGAAPANRAHAEAAASRIPDAARYVPVRVGAEKPTKQVAAPTSPRGVVAAARARVKQIRSELKRMSSLKRELDELERLLKAAKQKPTVSVRPIRSVG